MCFAKIISATINGGCHFAFGPNTTKLSVHTSQTERGKRGGMGRNLRPIKYTKNENNKAPQNQSRGSNHPTATHAAPIQKPQATTSCPIHDARFYVSSSLLFDTLVCVNRREYNSIANWP